MSKFYSHFTHAKTGCPATKGVESNTRRDACYAALRKLDAEDRHTIDGGIGALMELLDVKPAAAMNILADIGLGFAKIGLGEAGIEVKDDNQT